MAALTGRRGSGRRRSPARGLRARLDDAEATLKAIRAGQVDAVVLSGPGGERTLAFEGSTHPYDVLLNAMSDGAVLLDPNGTILFGNRRFGDIARVPLERLRGSRLQRFVATAERENFEGFLREGVEHKGAREFALARGDEPATPAWITLSTVPLGAYPGAGAEGRDTAIVLMAIVTDLTDRKQAEATRLELMKHLISAEDDERRRIARELHDETGQSLTALLVGLRAIEEQALTMDVKETAQRLRRVASQTVDNVARLARGLHPSVLDDMGLDAAARRYVNDYAKSFGVAVDLRMENIVSHRLPPLVQTTLYRILQEALTNVARHARAKAIHIELHDDGAMIELVVRDDGVGFDASAVREEASGLGLHGMRERVALLGGTVEIESRPHQGTVVRARIPAGTPPQTNRELGASVSPPGKDS